MKNKYIYGIVIIMILIIILLLIINHNLEATINGLDVARHNCDSIADKSVKSTCYKLWGLE